jgi:hypothetical protein
MELRGLGSWLAAGMSLVMVNSTAAPLTSSITRIPMSDPFGAAAI